MSDGPHYRTLARRVLDGAIRPVYVALRESLNRALDWGSGIQTRGVIQLDEHGGERADYQASDWLTLRLILPKREVSEGDVFIDFGSGLGRVVYQAARYPFRRVIGVELSQQLNDVAKENISRNLHRLTCENVELVASDVLHYGIPDDVTVAYFANPFTGAIFETVIDRLLDSVDRNPRRLRIIYKKPLEHDFLLATGRVTPVRLIPGLRPTRAWSRAKSTRMYEVVAPSPSDMAQN